jgi:hypothetical protein
MNVTSGIVKNRSNQAPWLRESYDYGWKEETTAMKQLSRQFLGGFSAR